MEAIKAMVRNGRIETEEPLDLPEGTELLVLRSDTDNKDDDWDNTPEGIAAWLKWYDSLEPLIFTAQEHQAWKDAQESRKQWELAHADERAEKLQRLWR